MQRLRGFPSLEALLRTLLLHVGCGWSLRETAVQAKLAGIANVSDVTLLNRLRDAEDWLRQLCQRLWKDNGVDLQPRLQGRNVRLLRQGRSCTDALRLLGQVGQDDGGVIGQLADSEHTGPF